MIIAGTGHRPPKLGGYGNGILNQLRKLALHYFREEKPEKIISGMALGWDTAIALSALKLNIPLIAAVPFEGQEKQWPTLAQDLYHAILKQAAEVHIVSTDGYANWKMQTRNEWMVDNCDKVVALWDGSAGGTANCIKYVTRRKKPYDNLWDDWLKNEFDRIRVETG